jgi:Cu/Ag efflux protein CusF
MKPRRFPRWTILAGAVFCVAMAAPSASTAQGAKKEHVFRGKVEKVDAKAKTVTVAGENVDGWMAAMTMVYKFDKDDMLNRVKPGDQITAKVFDGDYQVLHDVKVAPPAGKPGAAPAK